MRLVSLEREPPPGDRWVLTLEVEAELLGGEPAVHISREAVLVEAAGRKAKFSLPNDAAELIDEDRATCQLRRRRGHLVIAWPASAAPALSSSSSPTLPAAAPAAEAAGPAADSEQRATARADAGQPRPLPSSASLPAPAERAAQRSSLDYSRFANIDEADDEDEDEGRGGSDKGARSGGHSAPWPSAGSSASAASAPAPARRGANSLDYSRFEEVNEDDATLDPAEVEKRWRRHTRLRNMRGEEPLDLGRWRKLRAKVAGPGGAQPELDPPGRGLWCKTNFEGDFDQMAGAEEGIPDEQLPGLPAPDLLSAMKSAPGARVVDATSWARNALKAELVKACATNRGVEPEAKEFDPDVRIDAIVFGVEVKEGNAAILVQEEEGQFLCAYRFKVEASYSVNVSERPGPGEVPLQQRLSGTIQVEDLSSGLLPSVEAVTGKMRTSMPKEMPKTQLRLVRPLLGRLELSFAYFVRRFERQLLQRAVGGGS